MFVLYVITALQKFDGFFLFVQKCAKFDNLTIKSQDIDGLVIHQCLYISREEQHQML